MVQCRVRYLDAIHFTGDDREERYRGDEGVGGAGEIKGRKGRKGEERGEEGKKGREGPRQDWGLRLRLLTSLTPVALQYSTRARGSLACSSCVRVATCTPAGP